MTATKTPDAAIPDYAPTHTLSWTTGNGETESMEWEGERTEVLAKYQLQKSLANAGGNIAELTYTNSRGRARLVQRLGRSGQSLPEFPDDTTVIEELYALDIVKDISEAPYFAQTLAAGHHLFAEQNAGTKGLPLSDDQVAWVRYTVENRLTEAEITTSQAEKGLSSALAWAGWAVGMKELRYHLVRNVDSYYETGFALRRSVYGVRTSAIKASMVAINAVADGATGRQAVPTFKSAMDQLIDALPDGEWLYRPPQAAHIGKGRWRISQEYQWAEKWSIVYGGSFNYA